MKTNPSKEKKFITKFFFRKSQENPLKNSKHFPTPQGCKENREENKNLVKILKSNAFLSRFLGKMTDLSEIRTLNNFSKTVFKTELSQFHGIIFAVLSSLCYRCAVNYFAPKFSFNPALFQPVLGDSEIPCWHISSWTLLVQVCIHLRLVPLNFIFGSDVFTGSWGFCCLQSPT